MIHNPAPITSPKPALSATCVRKSRLSRWAASSNAAVVRGISLDPAESDQPVPQILPLRENENYKDHDNPAGGERTNHRRDDGPKRLQSAGAGLRYFHLNGVAGRFAPGRRSSARRERRVSAY